MKIAAATAGRRPTQKEMPTPLRVEGVTVGTREANWDVEVPIAVPNSDGGAVLHNFHAPVIQHERARLPALLGLQAMSAANGVLKTASRSERLTLPGPGGYKIEWGPGLHNF